MSIDTRDEARQLVQTLLQAEMKPEEICEKMDHRVKKRTIYRWANGETTPQNNKDLEVLRGLVAAL